MVLKTSYVFIAIFFTLSAGETTKKPELNFADFDQVSQQLYEDFAAQQSNLDSLIKDVLSDDGVGNATLEYYQLVFDSYSRHLYMVFEYSSDVLKELFKIARQIAEVDNHDAAKNKIDAIKESLTRNIVSMQQGLAAIPKSALEHFHTAATMCERNFICRRVTRSTGMKVKELSPRVRKITWDLISVASERQIAIVTSYIGTVEGYNDNRDDFIDDHLPDYLFEKKKTVS